MPDVNTSDVTVTSQLETDNQEMTTEYVQPVTYIASLDLLPHVLQFRSVIVEFTVS